MIACLQHPWILVYPFNEDAFPSMKSVYDTSSSPQVCERMAYGGISPLWSLITDVWAFKSRMVKKRSKQCVIGARRELFEVHAHFTDLALFGPLPLCTVTLSPIEPRSISLLSRPLSRYIQMRLTPILDIRSRSRTSKILKVKHLHESLFQRNKILRCNMKRRFF